MTQTITKPVTNPVTKPVSLVDLVDRLAEVHALINELEAEQTVLKAQLVASGQPKIPGSFVKAVLTTTKPSVRTDWKGLAAELKPSQDLIDIYSKPVEPVTSVRLYAL